VSRYRFVAAEAAVGQHRVAVLCRVLQVARSGYYAWKGRGASARAREDAVLTGHIEAVHTASRGTYGSPRVHAALRAEGVRIARKRVARLMRQAGLRSCQPRPRRARTTTPDPVAAPVPDLVERAFAPEAVGAPDRLWVADISYAATGEGWLYLAVVLDSYSRKVVGWAMADHLRAELATEALTMAVACRQPAAGLVHHSDHGAQYTSLSFGAALCEAGILPSMGTVGDGYDNAVAESFFATLKVELLHRRAWPTRQEARRAIFEFIEVWYNRQRLHSTLAYTTPTAYEEAHRRATAA
jgi:putative transposase